MAHHGFSPRRRGVLASLIPTALVGGLANADEASPTVVHLEVGHGRLELQFAPDFSAALQRRATVWVERSARVVVAYLGRFPVPRVELLMVPVDGAGVRGGTAYGVPSLLVRLRLGRETTEAQFLADWILVHEMVHLAIPRVPRSQSWLHEGLATYVEGVARARAGLISEETWWLDLVQGLPKGQPGPADQGLDHTSTWGRTYWGGAGFCLRAELRLRERSANRIGLRHALQGLLAAGGNYGVAWPVPRILAAADAAVGQTTLSELYAEVKDTPSPLDLTALWRQLGIEQVGPQSLRFDPDAPLAAARRAILG